MTERSRLCSALSAWETIAGLCRSLLFKGDDFKKTDITAAG